MLPKHCCPQDVEEADLFQITGQPDLDLVKIVLVQLGPRWGLEVCSKATVWEPGLPQLRPCPLLLQDHLLGSDGPACALRVAQQPVVGPRVSCQGTETSVGLS